MFRVIVLFGLVTATVAGGSLDPLVIASRGFSTAIQQQILAIQRGPSLIEFAARTIVYANAKTKYFKALRDAAPELMKIAMGMKARPPELDTLAAVFAVAGEKQETVADEETLVLLKGFPGAAAPSVGQFTLEISEHVCETGNTGASKCRFAL